MPFIAPLIGAAIGGIAATAIGQAVIGAALSVAMAAASRRLAPKADAQTDFPRGAHLQLAADSQMPRVIIFGEAAVAGSLVYHNVYNETRNLELVLALADHECEAMTGLWVNGKAVTWSSTTGLVTEFPGMRVRFFRGIYHQDADADLIANSGGRWTATDRGRGVCYAYVNMAYDANLYQSGQPALLFKVKGARLYDWRKDSTAGGSGSHRWGQLDTYEWSDNPVVAWFNYRRGIFVNGNRVAGMRTAADAIPLDAATAAANACDETVALDGGGSEKRYRISAAIVSASTHREVIRDIVASCAGEEIDTGGEFKLLPGIARAPVMALTDDDLMADVEVEWSGRASRKDLVNAVFGSFRDPAQRYEAISVTPRLSSADEVLDGERFEARYDLDMVASGTQAQRVLEILRRRARRQGTAKATFRAKAAPLEPGDWITWTSARYGWNLKTFEVVSPSPGRDLSTELVLRETDADVYDWEPATDELDGLAVPDLPAGGGGITALSGLAVTAIEVAAGAGLATRPGLRLTWTAITDPSVIEIEIQTRKVGDTAFSATRRAFDPDAGQHAWVDGILGDTEYEVRARPVTLPVREVTWSAWIAPATATAPQVVDVGTVIPEPESVGLAELDAQTRFELQLATALAVVQGSAGEDARNALAWADAAGERALEALLADRETKALVRTESLTRTSESAALAQQLTTVATALGGNTAAVQQIAESVDGIFSRYGVAININGQVVGLIQLDGSAEGSSFDVVVDRFRVAKPDGTGAVSVFVVGNVNGVSSVGINGNLIVDGTVLARHLQVTSLAAIVANLGTITSGRIQNAANTTFFDLNTGEFQITAPA